MDARLKADHARARWCRSPTPGLLRRGTPVFESISGTVAQPGRPLEPDLQAEYGWRFGRDFGGSRVHTQASAGGTIQRQTADEENKPKPESEPPSATAAPPARAVGAARPPVVAGLEAAGEGELADQAPDAAAVP